MEKLNLSVPEAAMAYGVSTRYFWKLIADGRLPVIRMGARVLVRVADLEGLATPSRWVPADVGRHVAPLDLAASQAANAAARRALRAVQAVQ